MSDLWTPELLDGAARVGAWARPASTGHFTAWSDSDHPARRSADRDFRPRASSMPAQPEPEASVDIEAIRAEAFADALQGETGGPLAAVLAETVARLVKQVVGEVVIDVETLRSRAEAIAALVTAEAGPARLRLHPDDIARLDGFDLGLPAAPDHHLPSGTIVLETGEGWIEDGPQVRLARLRTQLDAMGMPR